MLATALAASSPAGSFSATAQQVAEGAPPDILAHCRTITDPAKQASCAVEASIANSRARIAVASERINLADRQLQCIEFLKSKKAAGVALDPTRLNREKGCAYAEELGLK